MKKLLGTLISGSLIEGFVMRIDHNAQLEDIKTGKFVSITGTNNTFFSLISGLSLEVTSQDILLFPPAQEEKLLNSFLKQKDVYATASLKLMLMLGKDERPMPVKTIPPHFSAVHEATQRDV